MGDFLNFSKFEEILKSFNFYIFNPFYLPLLNLILILFKIDVHDVLKFTIIQIENIKI